MAPQSARREDSIPGRMWVGSTGLAVVLLAAIAAHVTLVREIVRTNGASGWPMAGSILLANLMLGTAAGLALRFRRIPVIAVVATSALTEAFLWRPATIERNTDWMEIVALLGIAMLVGFWWTLRWVDQRFDSRR